MRETAFSWGLGEFLTSSWKAVAVPVSSVSTASSVTWETGILDASVMAVLVEDEESQEAGLVLSSDLMPSLEDDPGSGVQT